MGSVGSIIKQTKSHLSFLIVMHVLYICMHTVAILSL